MVTETAKLGLSPWRTPLISRIRFQLLGGIVVSVFLPVLLRWPNETGLFVQSTTTNTVVGSILAIAFGFLLMRRVNEYPNVNQVTNSIISMLLPFAAMMFVFFLLRIDYSRFIFLTSFAVATIWFISLRYVEGTQLKKTMALVPGGDIDRLFGVKGVNFRPLTDVKLDLSGVSGVVADLRYDHDPEWEKFLAHCTLFGLPVYHTKQLKESLTGKVEIEHLSENSFGSLLPNLVYLRIKQVLDIMFALAVLPFVLLVSAVIALFILATDGGPVLYTQTRVGYRGERFRLYKFRTMYNRSDDASVVSGMTEANDTRITPTGRVLRRYRLDELPQIINIFRGEMSWIGPRPEVQRLSEWYEDELPFYPYRHVVRPGISGWAQVNQGHVADPEEVLGKLHYDFFYIKYLSPWLDLLVALKTARTILTGFGSK